ncbi:hypothetical protein R3W88_003600 [Solanum pinnatisectum]|uniref:Uncharacterized protein n=1 Tax=Solanum pinnatisectum TaxID=50273 RepID=A0AAV9MQ61_9SOLN|nr:hypothetical protein R3W88_003600 [Solanum pinnatisectum]
MDYGMMAGNSECSSGCESGWTLYLENSYLTSCKGEKSLKQKQETEEAEEEDLSMVSDASSGPPNFHQEEAYGHNTIINGGHYYAPISNPKRQKAKDKKQKQKQKQLSVLDDTASSPIFDFSNNNFSNINNTTKSVENNVLDFSQGYSATHFQGQEHYGYFQSSLLPGNKLQENQWFEEKRWG